MMLGLENMGVMEIGDLNNLVININLLTFIIYIKMVQVHKIII